MKNKPHGQKTLRKSLSTCYIMHQLGLVLRFVPSVPCAGFRMVNDYIIDAIKLHNMGENAERVA